MKRLIGGIFLAVVLAGSCLAGSFGNTNIYGTLNVTGLTTLQATQITGAGIGTLNVTTLNGGAFNGSLNGTVGGITPATGAFTNFSSLGTGTGNQTFYASRNTAGQTGIEVGTFVNAEYPTTDYVNICEKHSPGTAVARNLINAGGLFTVNAAGNANVTGALSAASVSTGDVALKWKKITGNLDSGGEGTPAHGCGANIVAVSLSVYNSGNGIWISGLCIVTFDNNYLYFYPGTGYSGEGYRVIVWYQ